MNVVAWSCAEEDQAFRKKKRITDLAQLFNLRLEWKLMSVLRGWSD